MRDYQERSRERGFDQSIDWDEADREGRLSVDRDWFEGSEYQCWQVRNDQLSFSKSYFNSLRWNARGCDLFKRHRCTHINTETWHRNISSAMRHDGKGTFHLRLGRPHTLPKGHARPQWVVFLLARQTPPCPWSYCRDSNQVHVLHL